MEQGAIIGKDVLLSWIENGIKEEKEAIIKAYLKGRQQWIMYDPERHGNKAPGSEEYYKNKYNE